ncbi:MAG: copper chaperone PCu(A)C [Desulfurococcales archaeon]|nr:copper chaperone PCu(A)C [Desulfurococcales archaeon]
MDAKVIAGIVALVVVAGLASYMLASRGGGLEFIDGYAIALPMGGGAFMTIHNGYKDTVCLVKAEIPSMPDARVELHQTVVDENGIARMQPVEKICAGPGENLELKHGGYHIMILDTKLEPGSTLELVLYFDNGDTLTVTLPVKAKGE